MKEKIALVLGGGGLRGAYSAGVVSGLDIDFDGYYGSSVGVFATTFHLAGQKDTIERTWKDHVHGKRLINLRNHLHKNGRHKLDLRYLVDTFQNEISRLNLDAVFDSNGEQRKKLVYTVTDIRTGKPEYVRPTRSNIFLYMMASAALPFVYPPVMIEGREFRDGWISDPLPVRKAIEEGHDKIIVVMNKSKNDNVRTNLLWYMIGLLHPKPLRSIMQSRREIHRTIDNYLGEYEGRIEVIRPTEPLPLRSQLDTDKERIDATFEIGRRDAQKFMEYFKVTKSHPIF